MMIELHVFCDLLSSFPKGTITDGRIVAYPRSYAGFRFSDCENKIDLQCKVLEWFSREAFKSQPFASKAANDKYHKYMLNGINQFLQTKFTAEDMETIYTYCGNECNRKRTIQFIISGYDLDVLHDREG